MYIGEVAKQTGLSIKAIRLYEEMGLIRTPKRQGRYRVYNEQDVEVLRLIFEAKQLGVTLSRLKNVIVYDQGEVDWARIRTFLHEVRAEFQQQLLTMQRNIERVSECIGSLDECSLSEGFLSEPSLNERS
ncbi:MerR family transcriptional regulator [Litoribrevibacter euphylliae]|uniref:MerR family transcriptional regulator n=1 Tax=Litoribrevibacter euphylliae TaxID=1834034 RepID=A0ABV7HGM0_9GAMM